MARHRHRRSHRTHRSSRGLIAGISNTTLALGAGAAYLLMSGRLKLPGTAGLGLLDHGLVGTRPIGPGLGAVLTAQAIKAQPWSWGGANYSWGRPSMPPASAVLRANPTHLRGLAGFFDGFRGGLGGFEATHAFWPATIEHRNGLGALVHLLRSPVVVGDYGHLFAGGHGVGSVHAVEDGGFSHLFAGGHRSRGTGRFNNVSLNRRWWT